MVSRRGPGPWCGTVNGYSNHKCRCNACREAWADYFIRVRDERAARGSLRADGTEPPHGDDNTYGNYRCRCTPCRTAHAAATKARRARQVLT
jgi:hypothetical protein